MKFTVELEDKTVIVEADRVYIVDGLLNFYNIRNVPLNIGGQYTQEEKDIVGSFGDYKNFYINGDSNYLNLSPEKAQEILSAPIVKVKDNE